MQLNALPFVVAAGVAACFFGVAFADTTNTRAVLDKISSAAWSSNFPTLLTDVMERVSPTELEELANAGDARAQNLVGEAYLIGVGGFPLDEIQGVQWLQRSAMQGFAGAQSSLGWAYESGTGGLPVDFEEAARLYRLAAAQDEAGGLVNLGALYLQGRGVPQDFAEARRLFLQAEPHQVAPAIANLGLIYENGLGVPINRARAIDYYRRCGTEFCLVRLMRMNAMP